MREVTKHDAASFDLRPRLTRRLRQQWREGRSIVIVGGPAMGKSTALDALRLVRPDGVIDDAGPTEVRAALAAATPFAASLDVRHYALAQAAKERAIFVPLSNVPKVQWRRLFPEAASDAGWSKTTGHPGLFTLDGEARAELHERWRALLRDHASQRRALQLFDAPPEGARPSSVYRHMRDELGASLKPTLDWLACAGLVTRFIDGPGPGVVRLAAYAPTDP